MLELKYLKFAVYSSINIFYGIIITSFGPIILYFAEVTHKDETYFSFMFFSKAIGFFAGGLLVKLLIKYFSYHSIVAVSIVTCCFVLIISSLNLEFLNLFATTFVVGLTMCITIILCNVCIFRIFSNDRPYFWFMVFSIFFSIGGFIGPNLVLLTKQLVFRAIGIMFFLCVTPILMLQSPEKEVKDQQQIEKNDLVQLPMSAEIGMSLLMFLLIGLLYSCPNWQPTYAVKSGFFNKQKAGELVSIYWIATIIGKIANLFVETTVVERIFMLMKLQVFGSFVCIILQLLQYFTFVCYFQVISTGLFLSALYSLIYVVPQEHGYDLTPSTAANLSMSSAMGQGLIAIIGYTMGEFGYKAFVYAIFLVSLMLLGIFFYTNQLMIKNSTELKKYQAIQSI